MENKDLAEEENENRTRLLEELREQMKERRNREHDSLVYLDIPCPVCGNKTIVAYAEDDRYCERCCWDYDGITDENELSAINGTTIREYRLQLLNDLLQEKWEREHKKEAFSMPVTHPRYILVAKSDLEMKIMNYDNPKNLLQVLAFGEAHPRFEEWLVKACLKLQAISSFVYPKEIRAAGGTPKIIEAKLSEKEYEDYVFNPFCENLEECRDQLEDIFEEDGRSTEEVTDELVRRTFEKYCAVKRYTLPMIANTSEYEYFSFFRHIVLYVVRNDVYPDAQLSGGYKYPDLPGMSECEIDFDY